MPSRQSTVVVPDQLVHLGDVQRVARMRVISFSNTGLLADEGSEIAAPLLDADELVATQLTVVTGTEAAASSLGIIAMMSSSWIGLLDRGPAGWDGNRQVGQHHVEVEKGQPPLLP